MKSTGQTKTTWGFRVSRREAMFSLSKQIAGICLSLAGSLFAFCARAEPQTLEPESITRMLSSCIEVDGLTGDEMESALGAFGYLPVSKTSAMDTIVERLKARGDIFEHYLNSPSAKQQWYEGAARFSSEALTPRLANSVVSVTAKDGTLLLIQSPNFVLRQNGTMIGLAHSCTFYVHGWVDRHAMAQTLENYLLLNDEYHDTPPADWGYVRSRSSSSLGIPYVSIVATVLRSVPDATPPQIELSISLVHDDELPTDSIMRTDGVANQ